jgi:uncharacterized spore protein YtfJ
MMPIEEVLGLLSTKLGQVANSRTVVGEALTLGDVTLVPVSRVSMGLGGGGGEGEGMPHHHHHFHGKGGAAPRGKGNGLGGGGAVKVAPVAVIAFTPTGVQVLPVPEKSCWFERMADRIPEWIERAGERKAAL